MRSLTLIALLFITGLISGCGGSGSSTPATVVLNSVTITGSVVDAKTSALLNANVSALNATTKESIKVTQNGAGVYFIDLPQIPSSDLTIAITATLDGYLSNSTSVTVKSNTNTQAYQAYTIPLVSLVKDAVLPDGVAVTASVAGSLTVNGANTTATLAPGTTLKTADGTTLNSDLSIISTNYPLDSNLLVPVVPGAIFATAGFTDVSVRDGAGNVAATLDKPVTITLNIAAGTTNPETEKLLVKGDVITVYTFVKSSGTWEPDAQAKDAGSYNPSPTLGYATVQQDTKDGVLGPLYVKFTTTHFSYWNLGFAGLLKCTGLPVLTVTPSDVTLTLSLHVWTRLPA